MHGRVAPLLCLALGGGPLATARRTSATTTTARGLTATAHLVEYATYNTSSPLGPWAPAELNEKWDVDDGENLTPVWCLQNNPITADADESDMVGQADRCLQLRVFQPDAAADGALLPVLFWIHGGIFLLGSGVAEDFYNGAQLATDEGMVVVTINYRLGPLGFLGYRGTHGATANAGILDQKVALEWTAQHIAKFGGDPARITVAGESAGATSAAIHMANGDANARLSGAILESNPAGINLKKSSEQRDLFHTLATKHLGCDESDDDGLMECLVALSKTEEGMKQVIMGSKKVAYINSFFKPDIWMSFYTWAPSIDSSGDDDDTGYISGQPNKEVIDAWPADKPLLIGTNEDEGRFFIDLICSILDSRNLLKCDGRDLYDAMLFNSMILVAYGWDVFKIKKYYKYQQDSTEDETSPMDTFDNAPEQFSNLVTDSLFTCPNYDMAMEMGSDNTFFYRYAVDALCSVANTKADCEGFSCHGDEIGTVFGTWGEPAVSTQSNCTPEKVAQLQPFVDVVQRHWGHFVREGTPVSANGTAAEAWNPASRDPSTVFVFGQESGDGDGGNSSSVRPTAGTLPFTTHHSEKADHSASEVCQTWKSHTYKSEESSASTLGAASFYCCVSTVLVAFYSLLCVVSNSL